MKKTKHVNTLQIFYYSKTSQKPLKNPKKLNFQSLIEVLTFGIQFPKIGQYYKTQKKNFQTQLKTTNYVYSNNNDSFKFFYQK